WKWLNNIYYEIRDNLGDLVPLPASPLYLYVNEQFGSVHVSYTNTDWVFPTAAGGVAQPNSILVDQVGGEIPSRTAPSPVCVGPGQAVHDAPQSWRVGSGTVGSGRRVQTNTLEKYANTAQHTGITTPAP